MFSQGQLIFGILFAIVFIGAIIYAYRKDFNLHQKHYKGSLWVLLAFVGFIAGIAGIKFVLGY